MELFNRFNLIFKQKLSIILLTIRKNIKGSGLMNKSIVLVDDDLDILESFESYLSVFLPNVTIKTFNFPLEALEYIKKNSVDFLITDVTMPKMTGLELITEIRKEKPLPAYVVTGYFKEELKIDPTINSVATKFWTKPVDLKLFVKELTGDLCLVK